VSASREISAIGGRDKTKRQIRAASSVKGEEDLSP